MKNLLYALILVLAFGCLLVAQGENPQSCPKISITEPAFVPKPDETVTFSVSVFYEPKDSAENKEELENLEYFWMVDSGKIIEGQRTKFVTIKIDSLTLPRAIVKIKGLHKGCPNSATGTIIVSSFSQVEKASLCPKVSVIAPSRALEPNENAIFSVDIVGENENPKIKCFWSVENGKIIKGQGTRSVTVGEIPSNTSVTVSVEVIGLPESCPKTASETIVKAPYCPDPTLVGEFDLHSPIDSAELDKLIAALKGNPTLMAYIIIYSDEKTSAKELKQKQDQIRKYLSDNNILPNRAIVINGGEGKNTIRLYIVPEDASPPNF